MLALEEPVNHVWVATDSISSAHLHARPMGKQDQFYTLSGQCGPLGGSVQGAPFSAVPCRAMLCLGVRRGAWLGNQRVCRPVRGSTRPVELRRMHTTHARTCSRNCASRAHTGVPRRAHLRARTVDCGACCEQCARHIELGARAHSARTLVYSRSTHTQPGRTVSILFVL